MEKRQIILPEKEYAKAPEKDLVTKIGLDTSEEFLREGDKTILLDVQQLFGEERIESPKYKIYGKLKMIFRNLYSGTTGYSKLQKSLYLNGDGATGAQNQGFLPYDEFAFLRRDLLREVITEPDVSPSTMGTYDGYTVSVTGNNNHVAISTMDAPYHNWSLHLSYVHDSDPEYPVKYTLTGGVKTPPNNKAKNGIPARVSDMGAYYKLITPVPHGIQQKEFVVINNIAYSIKSVGDEFYDSENYVINLDKTELNGNTLSGIVMIKRCLDDNDITGTTCSYYVHKHKVLTNKSAYIMDKAGFETPIFEDEKKLLFENSAQENDVLVERNRMESVLLDFKDPFILTGITNNLNFTPSEVYLSVIFKNSSGYFEYPPKVGYKFNLHNSWIDEQFSGSTANEVGLTGSGFTRTQNSTTYTFTSGNTVSPGTILTGAFVEYDPINLKERIISESLHKITNPVSLFDFNQDDSVYYIGNSAENKMGLYYQPHYRIKLRQLSPYIETSNTKNIYDLPDNAQYAPKQGIWKWRDVYDHGYIDDEGNGTNFPFVNGQHYVMQDINFYLRNEKEYLNKTNGLKAFGKKKTIC